MPWTKGRQRLLGFVVLLMLSCLMSFILNLDVSKDQFSRLKASWSTVSTNNKTTVHSDVDMYSVAYPHPYHFILDEPEQCLQQNPYLVIMIPVAPHNWAARNAIRKTWAGETTVLGKRVSHFFLLGQAKDHNESLHDQLLRESQEHHDLLQGDFVDSYYNLTIKTMVMLEWLDSRCPGASYGMKTDSDMFLNVRTVINKVLSTPKDLYMTGEVVRSAKVQRDPNSKWFLPDDVFPESQYPPYALGQSYMFSMDLPRLLIEASRHVKAIWIEDVYLGICMRQLGIDLKNPPANLVFFTSMPITHSASDWNHVMTAILESPQQLLDVWRAFKKDLP